MRGAPHAATTPRPVIEAGIRKVRAGCSVREAALDIGISRHTLHVHMPRTEDEIRADLARQLEGIVRRFEDSLTQGDRK